MQEIKRKRNSKKAKRRNNIRKAINRYVQSPKRKVDARNLSIQEQDNKFDRIFPKNIMEEK